MRFVSGSRECCSCSWRVVGRWIRLRGAGRGGGGQAGGGCAACPVGARVRSLARCLLRKSDTHTGTRARKGTPPPPPIYAYIYIYIYITHITHTLATLDALLEREREGRETRSSTEAHDAPCYKRLIAPALDSVPLPPSPFSPSPPPLLPSFSPSLALRCLSARRGPPSDGGVCVVDRTSGRSFVVVVRYKFHAAPGVRNLEANRQAGRRTDRPRPETPIAQNLLT